MLKKFEIFDNPRELALAEMSKSIPDEQWEKNLQFLNNLRKIIAAHPVSTHPAIQVLNSGQLCIEQLKKIHLEYRHAIVQIFTDALLMAQFQSKQLELKLHAGAKLAPRVLLSLNILDEFGFRPGFDKNNYYQGNPAYAHYPLFEDLLAQYGISETERNAYQPSQIADDVRSYLEASYSSYMKVLALLAVAEEEVILFSPPLRQATKAAGITVDGGGYYYVHGISSDETAEAADDDHQNDLWYALAQAITGDDYDGLHQLCIEYCALWNSFWDLQIEDINEFAALQAV